MIHTRPQYTPPVAAANETKSNERELHRSGIKLCTYKYQKRKHHKSRTHTRPQYTPQVTATIAAKCKRERTPSQKVHPSLTSNPESHSSPSSTTARRNSSAKRPTGRDECLLDALFFFEAERFSTFCSRSDCSWAIAVNWLSTVVRAFRRPSNLELTAAGI